MKSCDQFIKEFEKYYEAEGFLRLQIVLNKVSSKTSMYMEQSSGEVSSCKNSHKIYDTDLMSQQELKAFMKSCLPELPIAEYTVNNID